MAFDPVARALVGALKQNLSSTVSGSDGDSYVGSNDGAAGSMWTSVAGFINYLRGNSGSGVLGFLPAGTGAVARTVQAKLAENVSVKDFGAKGDGSTDDTAAIQAAITAVGAAGGGRLLVPPGTYKISAQITAAANVNLYANYSARNTPATMQAASGFTGRMIYVPQAAASFSVSGISFLSTVTADSSIYIDASSVGVSYCGFNFSGRAGVELSANSIACEVAHCTGTNLVYQRSALTAAVGGLHVLGTDHYITDNEFNCWSGNNTVVSSGAYACSIYIGGANHFLVGNIGEFGETGVWVDANKSRFTGNRADRCMGHGWVIPGASNCFTACQAVQCGTGATNSYDGWQISGVLNRFVGCMVPYLGQSTLRYGWNDKVDSYTQKNEMVGCSCDEAYGTSAYHNNFDGGGFLFGTGFYTQTSGSVIDVSGKTNIVLYYTTAQTVTQMTGGVNGQTVRLMAVNGNVTVHNNQFKTLTGADIVLQQFAVYEFTWWNYGWMQHA
ncbi:MAG TPA: glycosyl hydrolase family 28-related protein [Novosphingobium sp.]|nr:glycosyl hydrolase family 28-related protein [Novosphingobium sp.]HZV09678.1 glycosyl hydrolase family 28-related protein [Novosphingobium sp.]